jgi:hypothetical protein
VLDTEDRVQVVVMFNNHPRAKLGRWNCHLWKCSP